MKNQNKTISKKLISGSITVILILAMCLCLFAFVQTINKGYVSILGYSLFKVTTGSMEPTIFVGDLILTQDVPIDQVELNDIISFFSKEAYMKGRIVTHRVVASDTSVTGQVMLTTRGDANSSTDIHRVEEENYIGKVIWISSEGNIFARIMNFLSGRSGFFTCVAIPAILISVLIFKRCMTVMMVDIKRLKDENSLEETEGECDAQQKFVQPQCTDAEFTPEEYEEMRTRIRAELIEELKTGDDTEQSKTE